jgi:archaellum component FlaD/FlaE
MTIGVLLLQRFGVGLHCPLPCLDGYTSVKWLCAAAAALMLAFVRGLQQTFHGHAS